MRPITLHDGSILAPRASADFTTDQWAARRKAVEDAAVRVSIERARKGREGQDIMAETKADGRDLFEAQQAQQVQQTTQQEDKAA